jgi:hypothetical protein
LECEEPSQEPSRRVRRQLSRPGTARTARGCEAADHERDQGQRLESGW